MDVAANLFAGLMVALQPVNVLYCLVGTLIGTLIGVLPGIGPMVTIAMLLPITYYLPPVAALIMLSGIYYGAQYGGSTTAILVNMPGESSSLVTAIDGHQLARRGRAGPALAVAALASLFAGIVATLVLAFLCPVLIELALMFGPAEYFMLMVLGLIAAIVLAQGSIPKALAMILLGLLLGSIGTDVQTGDQRFTFGVPEMLDGVGFIPLAMGLFAVTEVYRSLEQQTHAVTVSGRIANLWPSRDDFARSWPAVLRGSALGSALGILPGGGALLASFVAYATEKRLAAKPERFGKGAMEGVAAPESANNAAAQTSFVPLLTLGIPSNPVIALMAGAMMMHGIQPGPQVIESRPELFWGLIASMLVGNVLLVVINLPLIGIWVRLLRVPYRLLFPAILVFTSIGVFSLNNQPLEVLLLAVFGLVGIVLVKLDCEPAPLLLAFIIGPLMEEYFRRAMQVSRGNPAIFVERPISAVLLTIAASLILVVSLPNLRRLRNEAFRE
jgi:putative tricarboxylic transport membrane protein